MSCLVQLAETVALGEEKACLAAEARDLVTLIVCDRALKLVDAAAKLILGVRYCVGAYRITVPELVRKLIKLRLAALVTVYG